MHPHSSTLVSAESIPVRKGLVVLSGYSVRVVVEHGRLTLSDGSGRARRKGVFSKATCRIKRLVIHGHSGTISLEALRWLYDLGAAVIQIDHDGNLILASVPLSEAHVQLRRAQAISFQNGVGLELAKRLIRIKLEGQAHIADLLGHQCISKRMMSIANRRMISGDVDRIRRAEATGAALYWNAWKEVSVQYTRRGGYVPEHWRTLGSRVSPITDSPRNAASPLNALLNYGYAVLEAEARIALLTIGLDPGLGLFHADQPGRDSLALDIMEAVRPEVDLWVLDLAREYIFSPKDFFERRDGSVRIAGRLALLIAGMSPTWARAVGPVAESVAKDLLNGNMQGPSRESVGRFPTPLTQDNRSRGRDAFRQNPRKAPRVYRIQKSCVECGGKLPQGRRRFCSPECVRSYKRHSPEPEFYEVSQQTLKKKRTEGSDPAHGGTAARKRGNSNRDRARQRKEWELAHGDGEELKAWFSRVVTPALALIPVSSIIRATGFSPRYASLVKKGEYIPHPVHYPALSNLVGIREVEDPQNP
jgi:CRISPR-associated endonuclease Cas1